MESMENIQYKTAYENGRKEQLEQDIEMVRNVALRSEGWDDFKGLLREELRKVDTSLWF